MAFKRVEEAFAGEVAKAGFESEEDMRDYMREIRKEVRGIRLCVMLDTNVFISLIFFTSGQTRELASRLTDEHRITVCAYMIEELRLVIDRKFSARKVVDGPEEIP